MMRKRIVAFLLMMGVFTTGALAANTYQKSITVNYGINLEIDGYQPTLTDANGKIVQPFTYKGTTYVPIRAVAENMGCYVGYDANTNTAIVDSDALESVVVAHAISEASHNLFMAVELLYSDCDLYNDGYSSYQQTLQSIQSIAGNIDNNYNAAIAQYNAATNNQNIYLDELSTAYSKLDSEYRTAVSAVSNSVGFVGSKSKNELIAVSEALREFISPASDEANAFINSVWS